MYFSKSILCIAASGVLAFGLSACSGSNPLKEKDSTVVANFLIDASKSSEQKLNISSARGMDYGHCMKGNPPQGLDCQKLYKLMTEFAKTQTNFEKINVKNLTDKSMFAHIKDEYDKQAFYSI